MSKSIKKVVGVAAPIIGGVLGGPAGAAIGGAVSGATSGKGLKGIGIGALTGYAGNVIGSSLGGTLSNSLGKVGSTTLGRAVGGAGNVLGPLSGSSMGLASNAITNSLANTTIGGALGKYAGNSIAGSLSDSFFPEEEPKAQGPSPFSPSREGAQERPSSLSAFGDLSGEQETTNLATEGVYGGGVGPQEEDYFLNSVNRRLIDDSGSVDTDLNEISGIENSYLSQLGLGGYGDARSLLEALSRRRNATA